MTVDRLSGRLSRLRRELGSSYLATVRVTARGVRLVAAWSPKYQDLAEESDDSAGVQALKKLRHGRGALRRLDYIG